MTEQSVWIVAGEDSGDLHGANLARALKGLRPDLVLRGLGGPLMRAAGVELDADLTAHAATGLVEVLGKLPFFLRTMRAAVASIRREKPAAVVLIDFPDFNLRLAKKIGKEVPVVYYIAPQLWAWRPKRIETIREFVRRVLVIFPFEEKFYRDQGVDAAFVGHPLVEHLAAEKPADLKRELGLDPAASCVGLLPGSRASEFNHHAELFAQAARILRGRRPGLSFLLSVARSAPADAEARFKGIPGLVCVRGRGREILRSCQAAIVAPGTATVEAMLIGCPFVMAYRMSPLTYRTLKRMVKLDRFAMPNILAGREFIPELVQDQATPETLAAELESLLDPARAGAVQKDLAEASSSLGGSGASARAAEQVLRTAGLESS